MRCTPQAIPSTTVANAIHARNGSGLRQDRAQVKEGAALRGRVQSAAWGGARSGCCAAHGAEAGLGDATGRRGA